MVAAPAAPSIAANIPNHPAEARIRLAESFEAVAKALRQGHLDWDQAVVVFHEDQSRVVMVRPLCARGSAAAQDNATLAALQRAAVRWALPIE